MFVRRETAEYFEATCEVAGVEEVSEMAAKPVVAVVVISFDCCVLDRSVHSLNLTVGPGSSVWSSDA